MKAKETAILILILAQFGSTGLHAQGAFQNLDFESASVVNAPPYQPTMLPIGQVFPSWTAYYGTTPVTQVYFNGFSLGSALVTLISSNTMYVGGNVIQGNYTATLSAGNEVNDQGPTGAFVSAAIAQTSLIPVTARSLRFGASPLWPGSVADLSVTFNGQDIPFFPLANYSNYVEYGADISAFAGLTGELRFTEQPITRNDATVTLDQITFSNLPVPEPSVFGLSALGALLLNWRVLRRQR